MFRRLNVLILGFVALALFSVAPKGQAHAPAPQQARVTIVGSVVDAALSPLTGVAVALEQAGRPGTRTTTDAQGKFRFSNIAPGDYRVRAELAGFPAITRDLHVPADVATIQLPIVLVKPGDKAPADASAQSPTHVLPYPSGAAPPPTAPESRVGGAGGGRGGATGTANSKSEGYMRDGVSVMAAPPAIAAASGERSFTVVTRDEWPGYYPPSSRDSYAHVDANRFQWTRDQPLSTFGADVDTASYSIIRRFLSGGQLPPTDAVRIEELVNYFRFDYAEPRDGRPIGLTTEIGDCPWAPSHRLVLVGARAAMPRAREVSGRNIVLLLDVSGSMAPADRLPLIKTALAMFADTLRPDDRLAIVTYAGTSGLALPSTPARNHDVIQRAIAGLSAGGSTNGGQGLLQAYRVAREAFIPGGVNRVILATDGDFNVGIVNQQDLVHLIERERESGVFLSVFGVGTGNLKDATMEMLADKGNGNYAYLDSLQEARRVLIREGGATLETVAKDVKFQVEFNPAVVSAWKLLGYENRALAAQDFNNDRKDAGEMGAGHTVTVLYEVVPIGAENIIDDRGNDRPDIDPLRYQSQPPRTVRPVPAPAPYASAGEWMTVKVRYKAPEGEVSELLTQPVRAGGRVQHLPFASSVAEFGLLLRNGTRDPERWDALSRRVNALNVPAALMADKAAFGELVGIARGLSRLR